MNDCTTNDFSLRNSQGGRILQGIVGFREHLHTTTFLEKRWIYLIADLTILGILVATTPSCLQLELMSIVVGIYRIIVITEGDNADRCLHSEIYRYLTVVATIACSSLKTIFPISV